MRNKFIYLVFPFVIASNVLLFRGDKASAQNLDLTNATLKLLCTNAGPTTYGLYQLALKPTFQGGLIGRTMISTLGQLKVRTDQGLLSFKRTTSGNTGDIAGNFNTYSVRGTATAIRTSPTVAVGLIPVPLFTVPCGEVPPPGGGGGTAGGGGGTGGCVSSSSNNYCAGISSLVIPSSVIGRGTIGLNDPSVPKEQPMETKEPDLNVGEWQGQSWKPQDQS